MYHDAAGSSIPNAECAFCLMARGRADRYGPTRQGPLQCHSHSPKWSCKSSYTICTIVILCKVMTPSLCFQSSTPGSTGRCLTCIFSKKQPACSLHTSFCSLALHYCFALLLCTVALHYCLALMLCTVAWHYCFALLLGTTVLHCCVSLLLCSVAGE